MSDLRSVEHDDVHVVAVNGKYFEHFTSSLLTLRTDPFIETHYAVRMAA